MHDEGGVFCLFPVSLFLIFSVCFQVLLTEPPMNPMKNREKMVEVMSAFKQLIFSNVKKFVVVCDTAHLLRSTAYFENNTIIKCIMMT